MDPFLKSLLVSEYDDPDADRRVFNSCLYTDKDTKNVPDEPDQTAPPTFTKSQLVVIVDVMLSGAADKIQSCLPPVISQDDFRERLDGIREYIHGIIQTVGVQLPILYATVTGDGMGTCGFVQFAQFQGMVNAYLKRQAGPGMDPEGKFPDVTHLAVAFVERYFSDVLQK